MSPDPSNYVKSNSVRSVTPQSRARIVAFLFAFILGCFALPSIAAVTCTISATTIAFGNYDPLSAAATVTTGSVTASCTLSGNSNATVDLVSSYSTGSSGTYSARTMKSGTNSLSYNLYFDAAYSQVRGDGSGGSQTGGANFNLTTSNRTQSTTSTIYGRAPANQDVAAGTYTDTITVTITY